MILFGKVEELRELVNGYCLAEKPVVALDIESTGLSFLGDRLITIQFMKFGGYCPVIFDVRKWDARDFEEAGRQLQRLFDKATIVGMNLSFDLKFILQHTGAMMRKVYDIMLAEQVIKGLGKSGGKIAGISFDLKSIAARYKLEVSKEERDIFPEMDKRPEWFQPFEQKTLNYMAQDVEVLEAIVEAQKKEIDKRKVWPVVNLENRCLPSVAMIEFNGIRINKEGWRAFIKEKEAEASRLEVQAIEMIGEVIAQIRAERFQALYSVYEIWKQDKEAHEAWLKTRWEAGDKTEKWGDYKKHHMKLWREENPNPGQPKLETAVPPEEWDVDAARRQCYAPINISSPQQILAAFKRLGIPVSSTSRDALDQLPDGEWEIVDVLKAWRKANMFPVKFGEKLLEQIDPKTDRLHPTYIQIGADTGRMSCISPPWQQIPAKGDGARLRGLVVPAEGNVLLTADFSNIELRILADYSADKNMLRFFAEGLDLHAETARMMFNLPKDLSADEIKAMKAPGGYKYRDAAKTINFGLVYGMSANKLARTLKIEKDEAKDLMSAYFALYPGVVKWLEAKKTKVLWELTSVTVAGRKRYYQLPDKNTVEYNEQKASVQRKAMNTPIQGSSADITKLALALFHEAVQRADLEWKVKLVAVVHDELVVEAPKDLADKASSILAVAMDRACAHYLKRVVVPPTVVNISDAWEKA